MLEEYAPLIRYIANRDPEKLQEWIQLVERLQASLEDYSGRMKEEARISFERDEDYSVEIHKLYRSMRNLVSQVDEISYALRTTGNGGSANPPVVDTSQRHILSEDFTSRKICAIEILGKKYAVSNWQNALIKFCEVLAHKDMALFLELKDSEEFRGRKITYFLNGYVRKKTKQVPGTNVHVWINLSAKGIVKIMRLVLAKYGLDESTVYIYLRKQF